MRARHCRSRTCASSRKYEYEYANRAHSPLRMERKRSRSAARASASGSYWRMRRDAAHGTRDARRLLASSRAALPPFALSDAAFSEEPAAHCAPARPLGEAAAAAHTQPECSAGDGWRGAAGRGTAHRLSARLAALRCVPTLDSSSSSSSFSLVIALHWPMVSQFDARFCIASRSSVRSIGRSRAHTLPLLDARTRMQSRKTSGTLPLHRRCDPSRSLLSQCRYTLSLSSASNTARASKRKRHSQRLSQNCTSTV